MIEEQLRTEVEEQPYPLLFVTISGAHLYGFPSPDSDYDLRGVHILPLQEVVGLVTGRDTIDTSHIREGVEIDLVTHEVKRYFEMVLKKNGYVLEQIFSPLVVQTTPAHDELKAIALGCITRHHSHHYYGFAEGQWKLFNREEEHRVKPLLYVFRVLLTGIHLMRTGVVEPNILRLNETFQLPYITDLVARKMAGPETATLTALDFEFYTQEYQRLLAILEDAHIASMLPDNPDPAAKAALDDLLVRLRLNNGL